VTKSKNLQSTITKAPQDETTKIRELNDQLRREFIGGQIYLTEGVAAISQTERRAVITALREYDDFSPDNDPYGEHDFGAFTVAKQKYFFKISYYDKSLEYGSPDPADPKVTTRVLTLMFASEY
jgi:phage terminase large subunit GpA-like protein